MALQLLCTAVLGVIFGLVVCFAGYRFFLFLLPIWGFFAGFALGAGAIANWFGEGFLATTTSWIVGFVVALVFAVLAYLFYAIGVAIFSGSIGYALGAGVLGLIGIIAGWIVVPVGIVCAVIAVLVTFMFNLQKYVIIAFTAFGGAASIIGAILLMFGRIPLEELGRSAVQLAISDSWLWMIFWLVLGAAGVFWQMRSTTTYVIEERTYMQRSF